MTTSIPYGWLIARHNAVIIAFAVIALLLLALHLYRLCIRHKKASIGLALLWCGVSILLSSILAYTICEASRIHGSLNDACTIRIKDLEISDQTAQFVISDASRVKTCVSTLQQSSSLSDAYRWGSAVYVIDVYDRTGVQICKVFVTPTTDGSANVGMLGRLFLSSEFSLRIGAFRNDELVQFVVEQMSRGAAEQKGKP